MKRALPYFLLSLGLFSLGLGLLWRVIFKPVTEVTPPPEQAARACVQPAAIQFPAPDLELTNLAGDQVRLDEYRGQVVLLNTWATWCPPCRAEMPDLQQFFERHQSEGFTILAVNIGETAEVVSEFQESQSLTFPVWLDPTEVTLRALNTISLPYSVVIDRSGQVQLAWSGATCLATLESEVAPLFQ